MQTSWVPGADQSGHSVHHLPYGSFTSPRNSEPRLGVRIGDRVLDLCDNAEDLAPEGPLRAALRRPNLQGLLPLGRESWDELRTSLQRFLTDPAKAHDLVDVSQVSLHAAFEPADYVDYYASEHHATNLGRLFRPDSAPLMPNWKHLPVGYHGRAGTLVPSGVNIKRPSGQRRTPDGEIVFGPSARLDIEAEMGFVVGAPTALGDTASVDSFADHVFGLCLVNDWSARDIQAWEYQPLGPYLGKSFATSYGAWITPLAALEAAKTEAPEQDPRPLPYLTEKDRYSYDIELAVTLNGTTVSRPNYRDMYWTPAQMLAHMTVNGASLRPGDFYASGTISGPERSQVGAFIELTWGGKEPMKLDDGTERTFLKDGDIVSITATARGAAGTTLELAEVTAGVLPAD
ncbi:fumarylacetoacetase [Salininema proteolyticum]|uniref:fumarylacetoacetase n=1 Tax=Salininema proteolyticum TaxID=1607685 RepID=A0ABV8TZ83_9ACTN